MTVMELNDEPTYLLTYYKSAPHFYLHLDLPSVAI